MVDGVVVDVAADREHRIDEAGRPRPLEPHALVARHVHDQAAGPECIEIGGLQVQERPVRVLQRAVHDDVALGEERRERHAAVVGDDLAQVRAVVVVELDHLRRVDRGGDRCRAAVREHAHVVHPMGAQRRHGPARGRAEADDHRGQAAAVVAGRAAQLEGVQHGAVPGDLVVEVEDVQAERAVAPPVVHRLEGDRGEALVERELGHDLVLHEMRPPPQHLAVAHLTEVVVLRFGQQQHVGRRDQRGAVQDAADQRAQLVVGHAEALAVARLQQHARAQVVGDPVEVARMQRNTPLIRLARGADDAQDQGFRGGHDRLLPSAGAEPTPCSRRYQPSKAVYSPASPPSR